MAVTASTGIAATHMGGITIHSWAGIGLTRSATDKEIQKILGRRRIAERIRETETLIIDEVSMIDADRFDLIERVVRLARGSQEPFGGMQIVLCGDFFQLSQSILQNIVAVFDRASLIALPPELRKKYVSHMHNILPNDCNILLVSMQYPQEQMQGPPFAVQEEEVFELYESGFSVSRLECFDVLADNDKFQERGLSVLHECIYHIKKID